jgi:hypothetical protein
MSILSDPTDEFHSHSWHLVHTKPRGELRALENLERQGFEVFSHDLIAESQKGQVNQRDRAYIQPLPVYSNYLHHAGFVFG